jgi:hypothetical protein
MTIPRTRFALGGNYIDMDTVEYEGRLWLVPDWIEYPGTGLMKPTRMIALDQLGYSAIPNFGNVKWVISHSPPKELFEGPALSPKVASYEVLVLPEVQFPIPSAHH